MKKIKDMLQNYGKSVDSLLTIFFLIFFIFLFIYLIFGYA